MRHCSCPQLFLYLLMTLQSLLNAVTVAATSHENAQVEWVRSKGGFFSDKLEFQLLDPTDPDSPRGVFAIQDIANAESVMIIPKVCLLTAGEHSKNICDTVRNLLHQVELGEDSEFAPYVNYLLSMKPGNLPSAWSDEGKELLIEMLGKEWAGRRSGVTNISFKKNCKGSGDPFEEQMYLQVYSRGWDDKMVPVFDMTNHRNGHWANVDSNSIHAGRDIYVFAVRDIKAGEQLHFSYYNCADCNEFARAYGAPDLLMDFGFVEPFPQRWRFPKVKLSFDLDVEKPTSDDEDDDEQVSGNEELVVRWITGEPDEKQLEYLEENLDRLDELRAYLYEEAEDLDSSHEKDVIISYYEAIRTAMKEAISASEKLVGENEEECKATDGSIPNSCSGVQNTDDLIGKHIKIGV